MSIEFSGALCRIIGCRRPEYDVPRGLCAYHRLLADAGLLGDDERHEHDWGAWDWDFDEGAHESLAAAVPPLVARCRVSVRRCACGTWQRRWALPEDGPEVPVRLRGRALRDRDED